MDALFIILLFAHFVGLMLIATAFLALMGMMPQRVTTQATAGAGEAALPNSSRYLTMLSHVGILVSLITGPLMIWVKYGGFDGINHWFWMKMVFLVVLIVGIVIAARSGRKMRSGDAGAASQVRLGRTIATIALFGVVFSAVMAFA